MKIGIIDYGAGNLASLYNALVYVKAEAQFIRQPQDLMQYNKVILPGVGAFGTAMQTLCRSGMHEALKAYVDNGGWLLGVCLGMQLLFEKSYEFGEHNGLGLVQGQIVPFDKSMFKEPLKVPHTGWNQIHFCYEDSIVKGLKNKEFLYFVHSFHAINVDSYSVLGCTDYGYNFVSALKQQRIYGFQPHPEKSHKVGLCILKNFCEIKE